MSAEWTLAEERYGFPKEKIPKIPCELCEKKFPSQKHYEQHMLNKHPAKQSPKKPDRNFEIPDSQIVGNPTLDQKIRESLRQASAVRESLKLLSDPHLTEDMMHNFGEIPKPKGSPSSRPK
jgi:hypothetical protein